MYPDSRWERTLPVVRSEYLGDGLWDRVLNTSRVTRSAWRFLPWLWFWSRARRSFCTHGTKHPALKRLDVRRIGADQVGNGAWQNIAENAEAAPEHSVWFKLPSDRCSRLENCDWGRGKQVAEIRLNRGVEWLIDIMRNGAESASETAYLLIDRRHREGGHLRGVRRGETAQSVRISTSLSAIKLCAIGSMRFSPKYLFLNGAVRRPSSARSFERAASAIEAPLLQ